MVKHNQELYPIQSMMHWWQVLLFPFSVLYGLALRCRNYLYDIGHKKSFAFEANLICVGNISVGGTGKTPMVDYLIGHFLSQGKKVATLSRGYGRKTKGFRFCTPGDWAGTVGDEPFTYFEKYGEKILVAVCESRALAIPFILAEQPDTDVVLLDDAFQHRPIRPSFSILLTTQERPFWRDYMLPSGRNREPKKGIERADVVIMTKSNEREIPSFVAKYGKPFFQTKVGYGKPVFFYGESIMKPVVVVAGLANNTPFIEYVTATFAVKEVFRYPDHYFYKKGDVSRIRSCLKDATLVTTHKDAVKLKAFDSLDTFNCAYIPIEVQFFSDEEHFLQLVDQSLKDYSSNH